ncbi:hypothetical protein AB0F93_00300 [Micromonospora tulbaghiae]|uniref:hypothetical protein n=1 Tax=Micromonospora tulbaghiae TaxID=479978 RepID=UPI0033213FA5
MSGGAEGQWLVAGGAVAGLLGVLVGAAWQRRKDRRRVVRWWFATQPGPVDVRPPTTLVGQEVVASAVKPPRSRAPLRFAVERIQAGDHLEERLVGGVLEVRRARRRAEAGWSRFGVAGQAAFARQPLEVYAREGSPTMWVRPFGAAPPGWEPERGVRSRRG